MNAPDRTDLVAGPARLLAALVSNYRCGHCTGEVTELAANEETGTLHARIQHDDGCPVLAGAISTLPDTLRAATPDTFRP
ncbi:hypothetical protein [Streptomyces cucumeris]|uniref:hypothetical protein n=1 Tax=Streptomyces cucumeris TaxID=2962890 RepID=UPI0020C9360E|nr:hypothetical protein [Streptomyces sp. NEAU-Y11]MCP9209959.1 hypothetical protein [Streptomyces sp. NEAU-Y11]